MTPPEIATMTAVLAVIKEIGTWPLLSVFVLVVLGPWVGMWVITLGQDKRHSAVVKMYEDNTKLVSAFNKVAEGYQDIVILSTQTMTQVRDRVDSNLFCPLMRKNPKVEKDL
jgi:hypothetical protein